jgi:hypothetical protein
MNRIVTFTLVLLAAVPALAGEGFGMMKKTANLTRIHPPQVYLPGSRVAIHATAQGNHGAAAARLQSQLESQIIGGNPRLKLDTTRPETVINVVVLQSDYSEKWEDRQGYKTVQTGTDSKGRPKYGSVEATLRFKVVNYNFNTTFKVHDTRNDRSLAADAISFPYRKDFQDGNGAPDAGSLETMAINSVVNDLTHRLAPTKEVVGVLLPRGSLETAAAFAEAGLWSKYQDALDKMPPFAKPLDEAYRQYALGVAYEAQGYSAEDYNDTLKYLEQASTHYNNAVDTNPKEGYFTKAYQSILFSSKSAEAPIARVQAAQAQYQVLKQNNEQAAAMASGGKSAAGPSGGKSVTSSSAASVPDDALTNDGVIDMLRAGLPEEVILTSIDSAAHTAFDVTPKGLIQLADAKASKRVMQHIQAVATQAKSAPKSSSKSKGKKAS